MELLCKNDIFPNDYLEFYKKFGVITPKKDEMYTIRSVVKNSNGQIGLLLNEIVNPLVPIKHAILGIGEKEPDWNYKRFVKLNGDEISKEEIKELTKIKIDL